MPASPFSVVIRKRQVVGDLKKVIKKAIEPKLDHLGADFLVLWKVRTFLGYHYFRASVIATETVFPAQ